MLANGDFTSQTSVGRSDIIAAVEKLRLEGKAPTLRAVREAIGRGSLSTINPFLREVLAVERSLTYQDADEKMRPILGVVSELTKNAVEKATVTLKQELTQAQMDLDDTIKLNTSLEDEKNILEKQVVSLKETMLRQQALLEERTREFELLKAKTKETFEENVIMKENFRQDKEIKILAKKLDDFTEWFKGKEIRQLNQGEEKSKKSKNGS